jgi:hypothetical protein
MMDRRHANPVKFVHLRREPGRAASGRELVAIVCGDVVGYRRLIGLNDIGTLEQSRAAP